MPWTDIKLPLEIFYSRFFQLLGQLVDVGPNQRFLLLNCLVAERMAEDLPHPRVVLTSHHPPAESTASPYPDHEANRGSGFRSVGLLSVVCMSIDILPCLCTRIAQLRRRDAHNIAVIFV
jgi:hypothetical protein